MDKILSFNTPYGAASIVRYDSGCSIRLRLHWEDISINWTANNKWCLSTLGQIIEEKDTELHYKEYDNVDEAIESALYLLLKKTKHLREGKWALDRWLSARTIHHNIDKDYVKFLSDKSKEIGDELDESDNSA